MTEPETLIQSEPLTYISEPLNSEPFCSFSWDSVKSRALFVSFFWKSFSESLFFFEGLPLAGPVLSLGKTPGIFPGGAGSGGGGRPGREAALSAHTCTHTRVAIYFPSAGSARDTGAHRALRPAPRQPPPLLGSTARLSRSPPRRPHAPARPPAGRSPAAGTARRARPGCRERARGPGCRRRRRRRLFLTATCWRGAGRRRRRSLWRPRGAPAPRSPPRETWRVFRAARTRALTPARAQALAAAPLKRRSGGRRGRRRPGPGAQGHGDRRRSASRRLAGTGRRLPHRPAGRAGAALSAPAARQRGGQPAGTCLRARPALARRAAGGGAEPSRRQSPPAAAPDWPRPGPAPPAAANHSEGRAARGGAVGMGRRGGAVPRGPTGTANSDRPVRLVRAAGSGPSGRSPVPVPARGPAGDRGLRACRWLSLGIAVACRCGGDVARPSPEGKNGPLRSSPGRRLPGPPEPAQPARRGRALGMMRSGFSSILSMHKPAVKSEAMTG